MPTLLPARSGTETSPARRLTLRQAMWFFILLARSRWLLRRLNAAHGRVRRLHDDASGDALLRAGHRWLDCHEEIAALLGLPPPPHVAEVREVLRLPRGTMKRR